MAALFHRSNRSAASGSENVVPMAPGGPAKRRALSDDEATTIITVAIASIQREHANADQYYVRGRNVITAASVLFFGAQALFVGVMSKTEPGASGEAVALVSGSERNVVMSFAILSAIALVVAALVLVVGQDRARNVKSIDAATLAAWPPRAGDTGPIAKVKDAPNYVAKILQAELRNWQTTNDTRRTDTIIVSVVGGVSAFLTLFQLLATYIVIAT